MNNNNTSIKEATQYLQKAAEKIKSTEILLNQGFYGDSISRAYYSVFHSIVAILRLKQIDLSRHKHVYILNQFRINWIDTKIFDLDFYTKILNIKNIREHADYSIRYEIKKSEAIEILKDSKYIYKKIKEYFDNILNK
jgi:hypothetical protein